MSRYRHRAIHTHLSSWILVIFPCCPIRSGGRPAMNLRIDSAHRLLRAALPVVSGGGDTGGMDDDDYRVDVYSNEAWNTVVVTHIPSGLVEKCSDSRSQMVNRSTAMARLRARVGSSLQAEEKP